MSVLRLKKSDSMAPMAANPPSALEITGWPFVARTVVGTALGPALASSGMAT
eukprot:CAMPEP_0114681188 /NCGR_PEP_ID=MMETSP0191-20121206/55097_1 /TAXON_ID=126664 /ORGANISM="Sorites sp." /LENGTH=51 /DNA_ID=CAMNT_0001959159 /DNA_START=132 /DNA_END=284 /DNA_ORIENTATION=+